MIVRALDNNHDWLFGKGKNDYLSGNAAVAQTINTRLSQFLGDCFFATANGIDWFNLLGSKQQLKLNLAINTTILNTPNVTGGKLLSFVVDVNRLATIKYDVQTVYGRLNNIYQFNVGTVG